VKRRDGSVRCGGCATVDSVPVTVGTVPGVPLTRGAPAVLVEVPVTTTAPALLTLVAPDLPAGFELVPDWPLQVSGSATLRALLRWTAPWDAPADTAFPPGSGHLDLRVRVGSTLGPTVAVPVERHATDLQLHVENPGGATARVTVTNTGDRGGGTLHVRRVGQAAWGRQWVEAVVETPAPGASVTVSLGAPPAPAPWTVEAAQAGWPGAVWLAR
jgi:hypothetical protein